MGDFEKLSRWWKLFLVLIFPLIAIAILGLIILAFAITIVAIIPILLIVWIYILISIIGCPKSAVCPKSGQTKDKISQKTSNPNNLI